VFDRLGGATLVPLDVSALSVVRLSTTGSVTKLRLDAPSDTCGATTANLRY
jgi:hypothetical protein